MNIELLFGHVGEDMGGSTHLIIMGVEVASPMHRSKPKLRQQFIISGETSSQILQIFDEPYTEAVAPKDKFG